MNTGLICRDVTVTCRDVDGAQKPVLREVCLAARPATIVMIGGPTGAGKTTLLSVLGGLRRPTAGEVTADGQPVSRWTTGHLDCWRRQVGFVFQTPQFIKDLTVLENVMLPLVPLGITRRQWRRRAGEALEAAAAAHLAARPVWNLSSGETQRVGLARALVGHPRFLLADEPTAHQDDAAVAVVCAALSGVAADQRVVVITSHDPRLNQNAIAAEHFTLNDGRLAPRP